VNLSMEAVCYLLKMFTDVSRIPVTTVYALQYHMPNMICLQCIRVNVNSMFSVSFIMALDYCYILLSDCLDVTSLFRKVQFYPQLGRVTWWTCCDIAL